ncbi:uncharacterized mitochondrial protein AtMg00810-like [Rutidosis leptorrhynchoides]|uniref:uncharacterized mitochondrial protein AtMg00810-like n=1 Tax=Rutidosis leptorrhynchoides TaxID=125765 RepID=UPI003A9981F3
MTSSTMLRATLMNLFSPEFSLKDLGPLDYFLGITVTPNVNGLFSSQQTYAHDILMRAGMKHCNTIKTPVDTNGKQSIHSGSSYSNPTEYRSLEGALQLLKVQSPYLCHIRMPTGMVARTPEAK